MKCNNCGSNNINVQIVTNTSLKNKHHSLIWWLLWGIYWIPIKWIFFTGIALLFKIFGHKKQKIVQKNYKVAICQNCGHSFRIGE